VKLRRLLTLVVTLTVLGAAAAAGWWWLWAPLPAVSVTRPAVREVVELVVASGRLRAVRQSDLGAEVSSTVEEVLVVEGDRAAAGQTLAVLRQADVRERVEQARLAVETARRELARIRAGPMEEEIRRARAEVARAESARVLAERDFERARLLLARELIAKAEMDRAQSAVETARAAEQVAGATLEVLLNLPRPEEVRVAEARLREAQAALRVAERDMAKRLIRAPFGGLVVRRRVEPGQSVVAGQALFILADMSRTELRVETDENNLARLAVRQPATVVAPAYRNEPFAAVLRQIGPEVDPQRGVVELRLDPAALPDWARPDMTVDVSIEVARIPAALTVPVTSLVERDGKTFVALVVDGRVRLEAVRVVGRNPEWAAVEGLAAEARVIRRAAEVADGQRVRAREAPSP
jgi:HlyD family secretion protein